MWERYRLLSREEREAQGPSAPLLLVVDSDVPRGIRDLWPTPDPPRPRMAFLTHTLTPLDGRAARATTPAQGDRPSSQFVRSHLPPRTRRERVVSPLRLHIPKRAMKRAQHDDPRYHRHRGPTRPHRAILKLCQGLRGWPGFIQLCERCSSALSRFSVDSSLCLGCRTGVGSPHMGGRGFSTPVLPSVRICSAHRSDKSNASAARSNSRPKSRACGPLSFSTSKLELSISTRIIGA